MSEVELILAAVVINGIIDCTLVAWLAGRRSVKALQRQFAAARAGDQEAQQMVFDILDSALIWATKHEIRTGRKVKTPSDEEGGEPILKDEVIAPIDLVARRIGEIVMFKFKGMMGGSTRAAGAELAESDPALASLMSMGMGPRKGQTTVEWALEKMWPRIMPQVEQKIGELINKSGNNTFR